MQTFWVILAAVNLLAVSGLFLTVVYAKRRIPYLSRMEHQANGPQAAVSVVVAARNEQRNIEAALVSLVELDYENLEIIVVEDRSTDDTRRTLQRLAEQFSPVQVVIVEELPPGWLGKNHALWLGAQRARGEFLLFTDADVVMHPTTLRRAMTYVGQHDVDHLTLAPSADVPHLLLKAFVVLFTDLFLLYTRPWKVPDRRSKAHVGIGAFNLVRKTAYERVGTHEAIAMRPDDDLKLGKIIKRSGFHQEILNGIDLIRVPWYGSLRELIRGMEKNAFSGVDYNVLLVILATAWMLTFSVWPFLAVWVISGVARWLYLATVLILLGRAWISAGQARVPGRTAVLYPVAVLLLIFIQWRAMLLTYIRGGIQWRGTFYPLEELRRNQV